MTTGYPLKEANMNFSGWTCKRGTSYRGVSRIVIVLFLVLLVAPPIQTQEQPFPSREVELDIDSGNFTNDGDEKRVMWSTLVEVPAATWLRLHFYSITLAYNPDQLESSVIRITSITDSAVQHLDSVSSKQWYNSTAYFNGDRLLVELIGAPGEHENRVIISGATAGLPGFPGTTSICGPTDDRILSETQRDCRVMPNGCTAFIIDDSHHQFLTAGHCADYPGDLQVVEFNVPLSQSNGSIVHPGPEDQYSVDQDSRQFSDNGSGVDWAYFGCFPNTETGLTAFLAGDGEYYTLADQAPPVNGQTIRITGYGVVDYPVPLEWNQVQKTHTGPYWDHVGTELEYRVDTTGGNSGSAVFNENSGEVIGIHTHAGCYDTGGANSGTAIDINGLQNALVNPLGVCAPFDLSVSNLVGGQTALLKASGVTPGETVYFGFSLTGEGEVPVDFLGVIIGISHPVLIGTSEANSSGIASIEPMINSNASGRRVWIQAAQMGLASIVVEDVVQ
jgi:V8-like Glu-specific endopeptidase